MPHSDTAHGAIREWRKWNTALHYQIQKGPFFRLSLSLCTILQYSVQYHGSHKNLIRYVHSPVPFLPARPNFNWRNTTFSFHRAMAHPIHLVVDSISVLTNKLFPSIPRPTPPDARGAPTVFIKINSYISNSLHNNTDYCIRGWRPFLPRPCM